MNDEGRNTGDQASRKTEQEPTEGEDIIDLTEVAEDESGSPQEQGTPDDELDITLDTTALEEEEEEIVELVDAAEGEDDKDEGEESLDLSGLVEEEFEPETGSSLSETALSEGDAGQEDATEDLELEIEEMPAAPGESSESQEIWSESLDMEQDVAAVPLEEEAPAVEAEGQSDEVTFVESDMSGQEGESAQADFQATQDAVRAGVIERLSEEKLENMVTQVIKETIEEKAERILLEVAEAAIAKEIEKIKKAL